MILKLKLRLGLLIYIATVKIFNKFEKEINKNEIKSIRRIIFTIYSRILRLLHFNSCTKSTVTYWYKRPRPYYPIPRRLVTYWAGRNCHIPIRNYEYFKINNSFNY